MTGYLLLCYYAHLFQFVRVGYCFAGLSVFLLLFLLQHPFMNQNLQNLHTVASEDAQELFVINNYKFTKTLGSGTFGKVKAAIHIPSGQNVAIKIIDKKTLKDEDDKHRVQRQVEIMKSMRHPNIIQFYQKIQTDNQIYLIVEYAENGELFKLMSDEVRLNQRAAGRIFIQLMNAVEYLHRLGIAHRDLKPENILLDVDYNIKLIDFGLSNFSQRGQFLHTACGSPCYAPPQMVSGNSYEGQIGDIWSMGIIFYGMICGSLPFEQNTTKQLYKKVIQGFYVIPSDISLEATEVIRKMLVTNPKQRITIPKLRKLQFFTNLKEVEPKIIGIIVGFHPMPIDNEILQKMKKIIQFDRQRVEDEIKQNKHTKFTTLYYLMQKQSLRSGGKTVVDLQYFLQSNERYKTQYGIIPEQFKQQIENSSESIRTIKNVKTQNKFTISNTKGLSREKRQPILAKRKQNTNNQSTINFSQRNDKTDRYQKPQQLFNTIKKYKQQKNQKNQKAEKTFEVKLGRNSLESSRKHRFKIVISQQKQQKSKQKISEHKSKQSHTNNSSSKSRKKSGKKLKINNNNKLALNLWNAYFEKPLQTTARQNKVPKSSRGSKIKIKEKQKQADKIFNQNLQKLKEGFLKLPFMKKTKQEEEKEVRNEHRTDELKIKK